MRTLLFASVLVALAGCDGSTTPADAGMDTRFFEEESWIVPDVSFVEEESFPDVRVVPPDTGMDASMDATFFEEESWIVPDAYTDDGGSACTFVDTLVRSCSSDTDCEVVVHQSDCCGNTAALGVTHSEAARFAMLEPACRDSYPLCGCPAHPTLTDSGESAPDPSSIHVGCISRGPGAVCLTYVSTRPPDGF